MSQSQPSPLAARLSPQRRAHLRAVEERVSQLTVIQPRPAEDQHEQRAAPRIRVAVPVIITLHTGQSFHSVVHDLSISGFSASAMVRMEPESRCIMKLPGLAGRQARVVWWNASIVGCAFAEPLTTATLDELVERYRHAATLHPSA
ncbi:MAG TPA: PilZ domain-containing protein [Novosphingobium sp.]|nr:PilZ domain-containing protein [Novosphingobium sp.]HZV11204.1 PilZ domain-containing protein [Novosphingobium sp.]